ncbi:MAG: LPXTG cell wall anchor domain-containing protein [Acidimicrobiia bacterium]
MAEELPRTGVSAGWMAGIGGLLLLLGLATRIAGKRPRGSVVS